MTQDNTCQRLEQTVYESSVCTKMDSGIIARGVDSMQWNNREHLNFISIVELQDCVRHSAQLHTVCGAKAARLSVSSLAPPLYAIDSAPYPTTLYTYTSMLNLSTSLSKCTNTNSLQRRNKNLLYFNINQFLL